jgi:hypothetical protein
MNRFSRQFVGHQLRVVQVHELQLQHLQRLICLPNRLEVLVVDFVEFSIYCRLLPKIRKSSMNQYTLTKQLLHDEENDA